MASALRGSDVDKAPRATGAFILGELRVAGEDTQRRVAVGVEGRHTLGGGRGVGGARRCDGVLAAGTGARGRTAANLSGETFFSCI